MTYLHEGHRERLRERVREHGFDKLKPHETIEFLLYYALPRRDVNELSHKLIDRFGSVRGVLSAPKEELTRVDGVGKATAEWLNLTGEAALSAQNAVREDAPRLSTEEEIRAFVLREAVSRQGCMLLCFDKRNYLIYKHIFREERDRFGPAVLREALKEMFAVRAAAAAIAVLSEAPFSPEERERAEDLKTTLEAAGIKLRTVARALGEKYETLL